MLQERDAQIAQLKSELDAEAHISLINTIKDLEQQVQSLEIERLNQQGEDSEEPVFAVKKETKKMQRSAAPRPEVDAADPILIRKLEAELLQAKQNLNDQEAQFEQLLVKQAEEMTAEFEQSLQKQASILAGEEVKQAMLAKGDPELAAKLDEVHT